jgi:hypothetical protein
MRMKLPRHPPLQFWMLLVFGLQSSVFGLPTAAPVDLGQKLTYVRLHRLPDDVTILATAWSQPALVVDLRYSTGETAHSLSADLPARPRSAPLFVLIGPATPPDALAALRERVPSLITLGLAAPGQVPDITLAVAPEADRRAYEAFDSGASIDSLLGEKIARTRFDEAALAHERTGGTAAEARPGSTGAAPADAPPPGVTPPATPTANPPPATTPAEPKDAVLQRAVQLHRALLALGKLPRG